MKSNIVLFAIISIYFFVVGVTYTVWNYLIHNYLEWAGTTALFLAAGLGGMIAVYLWMVRNKQGGELVEDKLESDIDDGDPELGEFSPWSWWPIVLAFSLGLFFLGLSIGFNFWMTFLSVPFVLVAVVGWVYEYYRGHFAR